MHVPKWYSAIRSHCRNQNHILILISLHWKIQFENFASTFHLLFSIVFIIFDSILITCNYFIFAKQRKKKFISWKIMENLKNFYKSVLYVKALFYVLLNFAVDKKEGVECGKKWEEFYDENIFCFCHSRRRQTDRFAERSIGIWQKVTMRIVYAV